MYDEQLDAYTRLYEIQSEIDSLISEASSIVKINFPSEFPRADAYWIAHFKQALGTYGYMSMCSMQDTITAAEAEAYQDELA